MRLLRIIVVCVVVYLVVGQCAWALYGGIKDRRPGWLYSDVRPAIEERMPPGTSGLPLVVFIWVFMTVLWPFPLGITASEDLQDWRKRRRLRRESTQEMP